MPKIPSLAQFQKIFPPSPVSLEKSVGGPTLRKLSNGMRVIVDKRNAVTSTFGVWVDAGSRYENQRNNGTAHFLEHLIFKGTKNQDRLSLEQTYENLGAHLNAYTARENTAYFVKCVKEHVPKLVPNLADIMQNSLFTDEDINNERSTIVAEKSEVERNVHEVIMDHMHRVAYHNNPLAYTILGSQENIEHQINNALIKDYMAEHYVANRMCLVCVGDHDIDEIVEIAEREFGGMDSGKAAQKSCESDTMPMIAQPFDMPHCHVAVGWRVAGSLHEDHTALLLWQHLFGSWNRKKGYNTSPIASVLEGTITSTDPFYTIYDDTGILGCYVINEQGESSARIADMAAAEIHRLTNELTEQDVIRAKGLLTQKLLYDTDGFTSLADITGRVLLLHGEVKPVYEIFETINGVTHEDMLRVGQKWLSSDALQVHMGPKADIPTRSAKAHYWEPTRQQLPSIMDKFKAWVEPYQKSR